MSWDTAIRHHVANLTPILCCSLGVMLVALKRSSEPDSEQRLLRAMVVPLFAIMLFAPLASDDGLVNFVRRSIPLFDRVGHIDSVLVPKETKEVRELFEQAGVKPDEPINTLGIELLGWIPFDDANGNPVLRSEHPAFLPLQPAWNFYPLVSRQHRIRKYFERFAARSQASGWLLIPTQRLRQMDGKVPRHQSSPRTNIQKRLRPSGLDGVQSEAQVPRPRTNNREAITVGSP